MEAAAARVGDKAKLTDAARVGDKAELIQGADRGDIYELLSVLREKNRRVIFRSARWGWQELLEPEPMVAAPPPSPATSSRASPSPVRSWVL